MNETVTRKHIVGRFHLFLLVVLAAITATAYYKIPTATGLPVHWGLDGKPDQVWRKETALLIFPVAGVLLTALFAAIGWLAPPDQVEPGHRVSEAALTGVLGLLCALQFALILIGIGSEIDLVRIVAFAVAAIAIILGVALAQSQPNAFAGIRLPWTFRSKRAWREAHLVTGVLFVVGGIVLAAVAWLKPDPADMLVAIFGAALVPTIVGAIVSLVRAGA